MNAPVAPVPGPPFLRRAREVLSPFSFALLIVGLHFALFSAARLWVLLLNREDFASLTGPETLLAFLRGLRFDASALFPLIGLPLFLSMLPLSGRRGKVWRKAWGWTSYALLVALAFVLAVDVVYFGLLHRHAGLEITQPGEVARAVLRSASALYLLPVLAFAGSALGLFIGWRRLLNREPRPWPSRGAQVGVALLLAVAMYFGERGTLSGKRLRIVHAFQGAPVEAAHLSLNGPYCMLHSLIHSRAVRTTFYPWPDAVRTAREALLTPAETTPDPDYPLWRARPARDAGKPNVVVLVLESWDASAADVHRRELGLPPLGCTPSYDALAREGRLFSRFYACGQRSMDGLSATLCGFPSLPGMPYLGRGLEQSALTGLGRLALKEGYDTWLITSPERDSFRTDAIAAMTGFAHFLGAEDIPPSAPLASRAPLRGPCWDHEMFEEARRRLSGAKRPFLAFLYTASTHHPFSWPDERWSKRPPTTSENRYLNSLEYADWALGRFVQGAKDDGWFDRTIFILTADHIGGPGYGLKREDPSTRHHVPGLVLAPGLRPGVDRRVAGQLDVIPTIVDLAGWSIPQAALGTSLFSDPAPGRGALCVQGDLVLRVEEGGFVLHSLSERVLGRAEAGTDLDAIERRLLSVTQAAYGLLRANRLARRD